ncbi:hypothetical protein ABMA28_010032 [Loxostege sticticalis]|uniref:Peptidase S1 domain-containing protein n=1 Tax=Loxostege sticticalis TaxID=481309 RepID=A0ABD0S9G2_LOXSC
MHVGLLFLTYALLVGNVNCDCDKYIACFGEFLRDFFGNIHIVKSDKVHVTDNLNKTLSYEFSEEDDTNIDKVLTELTSLIKEIDGDVKESEIINRVNNKTKIVVKTFDRDDVFENTEAFESDVPSTATEINLPEDISFGDLTETTHTELTTVTENSFEVIPLRTKNEKENEICDDDDDKSYNEEEENKFVTDYPDIDYIELYKDVTNEFVNYEPTEVNIHTKSNELRAEIEKQQQVIGDLIKHSFNLANGEALAELLKNLTDYNITSNPDSSIIEGVAPWTAAIFLKNETGDQFDYYCDGALVSEKAVLTAARCTNTGNGSYPTENFIVILGKTSLQLSGSNEKILRVKEIKTHENFTIEDGVAKNDLALLILEEPVTLNDGISIANLSIYEENQEEGESNVAVTTAWSLSGDIALIYFDKEKSKACESNNKVENTFCATYGDDVPLCPSYGGLYVTKQGDQLCLAGIRTGDPSDRGICFNKHVNFTSLKNQTQWISENIEA